MPLVCAVAASAVFVLAAAVWQSLPGWQLDWQSALLVLFVAVVVYAEIWYRVKSTRQSIAPTSVAVLACVVYAPPAAAVVYVAIGALIGKSLFKRSIPIKAIFNVSKETLAAAAAAAAAYVVGFVPLAVDSTGRNPLADIVAICAAAGAYQVVDEMLSAPVLSLASGTSLRQILLTNLDVRLVVKLGGLAASVALYFVLLQSELLLLGMPILVYGLHLASAVRIHTRTERETWQRLARATDEFNSVDFDGVLRTAVIRAAELFSVHEAEVEVFDPPRLVRGDVNGVRYDGPPGEAPDSSGQAIPIDLATSTREASLGELRLLIRDGEITLSERENFTLATFAAALCTAVRNAGTFAETQRLAESHARAAALDPLTDLPNRRRLAEYGAQVLAAQPPNGVIALLLIDLNHFKEINDTLGHTAGDQVLVECAKRLSATAQPDDLVARLGGDEFAILLVGLATPALALSRAHALLAALNPPIEVDGLRVSIEASGGVAVAASHASGKRTVEEVLRRADVAMYQAKRHGQRVALFEQSRDTADVKLLSLGGEIARAIAENEFVVNFQPIVDLGSGDVVGAEALTRWSHPQHGDLAPGRFLDSIERSGRLGGFTEVVLDQALDAVIAWRAAGFDMPVSVNVTPRSLLDATFPDMIERQLAGRDGLASSLIIELTESVTLSQLEVVDDVLRRLRQLDIQLALDDFGTGYSSLATLARVPVQELKIDRSFVAAMDAPTEAAVVRSTIELGRSLGLVVVAEGVESERQRTRLWESGCPWGQGHLFARPMPLPKLLTLLDAGPGGKRGRLAEPLHEAGSVIRMPTNRRGRGQQQAADGS
jgi:diguanylate cyclase (GGDEF)-like protein